MTKTKTKPHPKTITRLQDYALWQYCLTNCEHDGTFHQSSNKIHESLLPMADIEPRTIQRSLRSLVKVGFLIETRPRQNEKTNGTGRWIPAIYRVVKEFTADGVVRLAGGLKKQVRTHA
jgi:hypothetical protein